MNLHLEIRNQKWRVMLEKAVPLSVAISFEADRPQAFGVSPSSHQKLANQWFVGDTRAGGSCNVEQISFIPHCHGTHTESIGHLVDDSFRVRDIGDQRRLFLSLLLSIPTTLSKNSSETYSSKSSPEDRWLTREELEKAWKRHSPEDSEIDGLVIRSLPNPENKPLIQNQDAPYFTEEALAWIVQKKIRHLVVDLPSIDRMEDGGQLVNHRVFWNLKKGQKKIEADSLSHKSITELCFIPNFLEEGLYLLGLNALEWNLDATPSSPLLYPLEKQK